MSQSNVFCAASKAGHASLISFNYGASSSFSYFHHLVWIQCHHYISIMVQHKWPYWSHLDSCPLWLKAGFFRPRQLFNSVKVLVQFYLYSTDSKHKSKLQLSDNPLWGAEDPPEPARTISFIKINVLTVNTVSAPSIQTGSRNLLAPSLLRKTLRTTSKPAVRKWNALLG